MGMTRQAFVVECTEQGVGTGRAKEAYQAVFRDGKASSAPAKITMPEIVTRQEEPVHEGITVKLSLRHI